LHIAAENGRRETVQRLLSGGANPDLADADKLTAFQVSIEKEQYGVAHLLANASNVNEPWNGSLTPVQAAARDGKTRRVQFLLAHHADVHAADENGWTALHFGAWGGHQDTVDCLLKHDARIRDRDRWGRTALHYAAGQSHDAIVKTLLDAGALVGVTDNDGAAPLHFAAQRTDPAAAQTLVDAGADVNQSGAAGWQPLHAAAQTGSLQAVQLLIDRGADVNALASSPPLTPLQAAAETGQTAVIRALMEAGADPRAQHALKGPALYLAIRNAQYQAALELLDLGADPHQAGPGGRPLLEELFGSHWTARTTLGDGPTEDEVKIANRLIELGIPLDFTITPAAPVPVAAAETPVRVPGQLRMPAGLLAEFDRFALKEPGVRFDALSSVDRRPAVSAGWHAGSSDLVSWLAGNLTPVDDRLRVDAATASAAVMRLPWYQRVSLLRIRDAQWTRERLAVFYLVGPDGSLHRLNGTSPAIHEMNRTAPVQLSAETVLDYLRFFGFFVRGEEGPFYILEDRGDPLLPANLDPTVESILKQFAAPAVYEGQSPEGNYLSSALIFYSNALFRARFSIQSSGMVEMLDDEPLAAELPFRIDAPITQTR
jgi:ankyrin repeat protein